MKIRLGYACVPITPGTTYCHTLTYTNYLKLNKEDAYKKLDNILKINFKELKQILKYNEQNNIFFYRLSHSMVPLASHEKVNFDYINPYIKNWQEIGKIINKLNMRVDIHPDQYCILNSTKKEVVKNSFNILNFNYQIIKAMRIKGKIILHVGSGENGKDESIRRFKRNFNKLDNVIKQMILLENDDRVFNVKDTLKLCEDLNIPMVLDFHHYKCNNEKENIEEYLERIFNTWENTGLNPKMHFSSPKSFRDKRSHSDYINEKSFIDCLDILKKFNKDIDVMLECKAKDDALFRLIRQLKFYGYKINGTTIEV